MTLYDSVIANLKGVIGSKKDGVLLCQLDFEYKSMTGEEVPIRNLGYNTLYDFLQSHTDLFGLQGSGRYCRVINVIGKIENDSTLNLISLIQNTQHKFKKRPSVLRSSYKGNNYQPHYQSNYQPNYQTGYQSTYIPNYLAGYNSNYQPNYKPPPCDNYRITTPTNTYGFSNGSNLNFTFTNNYKPELKKPVTDVPVPPPSKLLGIYQHPNAANNASDFTKRPNLLVPIKCLMRAQNGQEKPNVLVISDDDESIIISKPYASTQTSKSNGKLSRRLFVSLQSLELVNMLIDVIVEFKSLKYNDIIRISVEGDLYYHFRQLSGFNVDPILFFDFVQCSLDSPLTQHLYKGLIYLDPSKSICLFNTKYIYNMKMQLPECEFDTEQEYVVEIVKTFHDNLVGFKILKKLNSHLYWKKSTFPEQTKDIVESQPFWSWIPGTLCLVQLPHSVVKRLNVSSLERAVILFTNIPTLENDSLQKSQRFLIHKTSFYLIDQEIEVENLYSCACSFQQIKEKAKENNISEVAFVCNMSILARNTPSKIQFTKLENFKDISPSFLDSHNNLKPSSMVVLKNVKKMTFIFHFQPMYSSSSRVHKVVEEPRPLNDYGDIELFTSRGEKITDKTEDDCKEIIVISDSEDETPVISKPKVNGHLNPHKPDDIPWYNKIVTSQAETIVNPFQKKIIIPFPEQSFIPRREKKISCGEKNVPLPHDKIVFKFEPVKPAIVSRSNDMDQIFESQKKSHTINYLTSTPYSSSKKNESVAPIVSYPVSDDGQEPTSAKLNEHQPDPKHNNKHNDKVSLSNSIISYLENNSNPTRKCLKQVTPDLINLFNGRIVKLLHVQMGSAVLMLFDSVKLMKREIKMMSLRKQVLQKAKEISIGNLFIWHQQNDSIDVDDYLLVEVMKLVSKTTVLTNNVHQGLLAIVNIDELFCLPEDKNCDMYGNTQTLIGPSVGAFNLHMFPDWFTPDESSSCANHLFTAFFIDDDQLVLEYLEEPCRFLNIEMISFIERSLTVNHCNVKSRNFIEILSKSLLQCRNFVGCILQMIEFNNGTFRDLPVTKVLCKASPDDKKEVWFASVLVQSESVEDCYEKLSPYNFMTDQFCIDRVQYDYRRHCLHLMEYQNVNIEVPDNYEGLYWFDRQQVCGSLKGNDEFLTRYMLVGASSMPDLKYLCNKLIFDIRPF